MIVTFGVALLIAALAPIITMAFSLTGSDAHIVLTAGTVGWVVVAICMVRDVLRQLGRDDSKPRPKPTPEGVLPSGVVAPNGKRSFRRRGGGKG